jgi:ferredoxin
VECIVPGKPQEEWPWYYIDPDTCIDCGACIPECPYEAIFPEDEVPSAYVAKGGEFISLPGETGHWEGKNHQGEPVVLDTVRALAAGDRRPDRRYQLNTITKTGPGYSQRIKNRE